MVSRVSPAGAAPGALTVLGSSHKAASHGSGVYLKLRCVDGREDKVQPLKSQSSRRRVVMRGSSAAASATFQCAACIAIAA